MKRKLGPLQLWQWVLIGAVVGIGGVLYRRGHPAAQSAQNAAAAALPSDAQYNPISPTTGMSTAGGVSTGASADDISRTREQLGITALGTQLTALEGQLNQLNQPTSMSSMLDNFGMLETLLSGLQDIHPASAGPAVQTDQAAVQTQTGTKRATRVTKPKKVEKTKKREHAGHTNPGHHVIDHGGGRKTPSSSAPHNARQHRNAQPPAHQRHDPTTHPSRHHPASHRTGAGQTPAAHPPAKREPAANRDAGHPAAAQPVTHVAGPAGAPAYGPPAPPHHHKKRKR